MNRSVTRSTLPHRPGAGQGLVEFSLIMPFLLVLFMGILDFGRVFFVYSEVSSAVREAIRFSAVNPLDCVGIRQQAGSTLTLTDVADIDLLCAAIRNGGPADPYDLTGDNRTVLKVFWGQFRFNSADTLADARQGFAHLLIEIFFVDETALETAALPGDLRRIEHQSLILRHLD